MGVIKTDGKGGGVIMPETFDMLLTDLSQPVQATGGFSLLGCVQTPGLLKRDVGCPQAPPPVCREDNACGTKMAAVKQKRIAAEDTLLPPASPDAGTCWSASPICALAV